MPRTLKRTSGLITLAALLAVMTSCSGHDEVLSVGSDTDGSSVQDFMESAGEVDSITVSDIYDQAVSEVVIVCAYTPASIIRQELGFTWTGAKSLGDWLSAHDEYQAVIALHEGRVVEAERMTINVLHLCDMGLPSPATIDAETTLRVSRSGTWSDGTTFPVASIE
ncbi:hypothetical protein [Nocardioides sp.]|uniref:hypothetical protein n=1 Tax=Nocardioides sp. TaxID=35761 RepID=UPI002B65A549|nr:hypothetical protein [Nocardioides sp.]HXH79417.1 hypothetical protein [Nocardioides sp.]